MKREDIPHLAEALAAEFNKTYQSTQISHYPQSAMIQLGSSMRQVQLLWFSMKRTIEVKPCAPMHNQFQQFEWLDNMTAADIAARVHEAYNQ